jgi:regulator of replication initiation timing
VGAKRCECSDEVIECKSCSNLGSAGYRWLEANGEIGLGRLLNEHKVLLDENERLKLTLTDERSLYADLAEKNEQLKKSIVAAKRNKVVETANDLAKLSQDGYQTAEEWTALMGKLIDALAQFGGDTYE